MPDMNVRLLACLLLALSAAVSLGEKTAGKAPVAENSREIPPELAAALRKLDMPGVKINLEEWSVDVVSQVCLKEGVLELIACTKDSKEHESIVMIEAKPSHVHTALLLLGAKAGNPAMHHAIDPERTRFRFIPPSGGPVDVSLVIRNAEGREEEKPISDFIMKASGYDGIEEPDEPENLEKFPTHTFLFAGSILVGEGDGPRRYLCDQSGNVISISTFGDELLCLDGLHDHSNESLMWEVDGEKLPELGTKVILRLRPQGESRAAPAGK
jgi:hypothetical protein